MLIDDHLLFSSSLAMALQHRGFEVDTPPLTTRDDLAARIVEARPDVAVIDRGLGALGDGEVLISVAVEAAVPAVAVSGSMDEVVAGHCYALGAAACVDKSEPLDRLLATVSAVVTGEPAVPDVERHRLIGAWRRWQASTDAAAGPFAHLTRREATVLRHLMDGRSVKTIAASSSVSETTVRSQVRCILSKLGVSSQLEAVAMALRIGWPGPHSPSGD